MIATTRTYQSTALNIIAGFAEGLNGNDIAKTPTKFSYPELLSSAFDVCLDIVKKTTVPEPHFHWHNLETVALRPSDYQTYLFDIDSELVTIEEDDHILREFCADAQATLHGYYELSCGWDGDCAPQPSMDSLEDAELLLQLISANISACPNIVTVLDHEGIPSFVIDNKSTYISLSFYGDYAVTVFIKNRLLNQSEAYEFCMEDANALAKTLETIDTL